MLDIQTDPDKLTGHSLKLCNYLVTQLTQCPSIHWHLVEEDKVEIVFDGMRILVESEYLVFRLTKPYGSINYPDGEPKENPLNKFRF